MRQAKDLGSAAGSSLNGPSVRQPGKAGNENAVKHGLYALAVSGKVPLKVRGGKYVRGLIRKIRRELAAEVEAVHGREPTLYEHAVILSITRHEGRCKLLERWLAEEVDKLSVMDRVTILKAIGDASDSKDKCMKLIGLDKLPSSDPFDSLYSKGLNNRISSPLPSASEPNGPTCCR